PPQPLRRKKMNPLAGAMLILLLLCFAAPATVQAQLLRVRCVTFNVNFNNNANQINADLVKLRQESDIIFIQESKWIQVANSYGTLFEVYQVTNQGDARAGSALVVRKSIGTILATGLRLGVATQPGVDMLDRYM